MKTENYGVPLFSGIFFDTREQKGGGQEKQEKQEKQERQERQESLLSLLSPLSPLSPSFLSFLSGAPRPQSVDGRLP